MPIPVRTPATLSSARQNLFGCSVPNDQSCTDCHESAEDNIGETYTKTPNKHDLINPAENEDLSPYVAHYEISSSDVSDTESDVSTEKSDVFTESSDVDSSEEDSDLILPDCDMTDEFSHESSDHCLYSETELNALCLVSYVLRHNSSGIAIQDLLDLLRILCPASSQFKEITYDKVMSIAGQANCKAIDYCSICGQRFPEDPDIFRCTTESCTGFRYKGNLHAQQKADRQAKNSFIIADVEKQIQYILERKGSWENIQCTKMRIAKNPACSSKTDISDGKFYRMLCQPGQFLDSLNNISALFNTDGINLYSSSNVKLWPIFLAINELAPSSRFSRENMILAAIWQGKDKPPFGQYMCAFGEKMCSLYKDGIIVKPYGAIESLKVRLAVFVSTMDLQAKSYVLNRTMHNGAFGCSTCEESGESVKQGKGYARFYPYRASDNRPVIRDTNDVKYIKGANATSAVRIKGICGMTGLASMPWFDVVIGIVPDYMHSVLLGVTKTLMYKFFSPTNSGKPYFIGKHLKNISKRLKDICPPDVIERLPRDLEKHYSHFKATELQNWLLFYSLPCLNGYLDEIYLEHLALLSEGIFLLLGDNITEDDLMKAETLLDLFYEQFSTLYGQGSCGLNVHNIGAHMVFYVRMWGPLWSWSCFAFEDWNAAILKSVHGTGDVTKQCLRLTELQLKMNSININNIPNRNARSFFAKMKTKHNKLWNVTNCDVNVATAGALKTCTDLNEDDKTKILEEMGCESIQEFQKALRVQVDDQKLYSEEYGRMKKRICNVVRCKDGQLRRILFFLVHTETKKVFAYAKKIDVHPDSFISDNCQHIIRVSVDDEKTVFQVKDIAEKLFLISVDGHTFVSYIPNSKGHSIFK